MSANTNFFLKSVCAMLLLLVNVAHAVPAEFPTVIPGPGLPSLESLGLTSAELYERAPSEGEHESLKIFISDPSAYSGDALNYCPLPFDVQRSPKV